MKKIIIIGAGPSGIAAAIHAKNENNDVIVLEKNSVALKKLLLTGSGRCNFYNDNFIKDFYNVDNDLVNKIISYKDKYLEFISSLGIEFSIINGYYYPYSKSSVSVQNALIKKAHSLGIKIIYDTSVFLINKENDKYIINNEFEADKIVIASGSKAYPKTGSTGDFYTILKEKNVNIKPVLPALVQLRSSNKIVNKWPLLRVESELKLIINNNIAKITKGELQLTNYGISGICTLSLSDIAVKNIVKHNDVSVVINFLPFVKDYDDFINKRLIKLKDVSIIEFFEGIINYKLLISLFKHNKINYENLYSDITINEYNVIKQVLTNFKLDIKGYNDFDTAQVSQGGVSLEELTDVFELIKHPGIYTIGELNDIHGDCGGYNLAYAFISGMIVGEELNYND